jgi:LysM repeat protein
MMMKKLSIALTAIFVIALCIPAMYSNAQGQNLLQNPGLESPYTGQGLPDQTAPNGWKLWFTGASVTSFPHIDANQIRSGAAAWNINKGFQVFTAGGYQQVPGIRPGSLLRASVYGMLYTCNDGTTSCINGQGQRISDRASGAYFRIGIDPSGGTDPNSSLIVWSNNAAGFDTYTAVGVDATACNTVATVFLYATQALPMALNHVYFDDASMVIQQASTTEGSVTCGTPGGTPAPGATAAPPTQAFAPFVQKQPGEQPDGSIVHTMVAGDTLAAIAVAYGTTLDEIRRLNGFQPGEGGFLQIGTKIIVRGPTGPTNVPIPTTDPNATPVAVAAIPTATRDPAAPTEIAGYFATNPPLNSTQLAAGTTIAIPTVTPAAVAQINPVVSGPPSEGVLFAVNASMFLMQLWLRFTAAG